MESIDRRHFMKVVAATPMLGVADGVASVERSEPSELESQQKLVKLIQKKESRWITSM